MEAMLAHATPPQDEVQNGEPDGESVHLSFGYGSDLTQFSDRVIRVHVVQDDDQDEASFGTRLKETIVGQTHAGLDVTATRANDQFVDLEMQSTGRATVEKEQGWSYDIPISSLIVAAHSVYFKKMLTSGLQESRTKDKPIEVTLSPQGAHFFNILIEFAYTHHIPPDVRCDKESLCWLLTVADRFEATQCIQKCAKELTSSPTTLEDAVMYLTLPETVKRHPALREAMDSVCDLTGWSFEEVATCENFCAMPESSMVIAVSMLRHGEDVETVFRLILQWFRNRGPERWSAFEGLLSLLGFWRMSPSFIRDEVEACPELRSPEGRTLVAEVKALEDPWEKIKADALQELAEVQGAAGAVAGAAAPVVLDPRMTSLMVLGWVTGFVVPLVFAVRAHNHKHQDLAGILAFLATFQILPAGGVLVGMTIGTLFGLKLGK